MNAVLLKDIVSHLGKPQTTYGLKNEVVQVISDRGNVFIVEGKTGKYSVKKKDLKIF